MEADFGPARPKTELGWVDEIILHDKRFLNRIMWIVELVKKEEITLDRQFLPWDRFTTLEDNIFIPRE